MTSAGGEIVCAIVDGASSAGATRLAARLAERLSLPLALVSVQAPVPPLDAATAEGPHPMAPMAMELMQLTPPPLAPADSEALLLTSQQTRSETILGLAAEELQRLSEAESTTLLVVADDGGGPLSSVFSANASRKAIRRAACPLVLVSHRTPEHANVRNILCGVDEHEATGDVAAAAADLAERLGGRLRFVHVAPRALSGAEPQQTPLAELDENSREAAEAAFDACRAVLAPTTTADFVAVEGDPAEGMRAAAEDLDAGFIVIGRPRQGALGSALLGSAAHDLLREGRFPVIVIPPLAGSND